MLSVFLYSSFVCFLGLLRQVNAVFGVSSFCCIGLLFFSSVTFDEEQADWTLLASAVPSSCLKDDLYSFPFSFVFNITKYKQLLHSR